MVEMAFKGWPVEAVEFYEGLEADNTKTYWQEHKAVYERCVKAPMDELLAELADDFGSGRVFRPVPRRPLQQGQDAVQAELRRPPARRVPLVLGRRALRRQRPLHARPDQLKRFRAAVDDGTSGSELESIVSTLRKDGYDVGAHEVLKTAPKGYPKDHPRIELLNQKGIVMSKSWPVGAWLGTRTAKGRVVACLDAARPLNAWLERNVG